MSDTQLSANGSHHDIEPGEQTELLKRGLVRVSIAAAGIDPLLDKRLNELRRALRAEAPVHLLGELLPDLERAVLAADQTRQQRAIETTKALQELIEQLHECDPPKEVARSLRELDRQLDEQADLPRLLPAWLAELQHLQRQTLQQEQPAAAGGLWSRLLGRKERAGQAAAADKQIDTADDTPLASARRRNPRPALKRCPAAISVAKSSIFRSWPPISNRFYCAC